MLNINNLSKSFAGRYVLQNISYIIPNKAIIALVGVNGAGKSTLLNILCNLEEPESGSISKSKDCIVGYLPQDPNPNPKESILLECMTGEESLYKIKSELALVHQQLENYSEEIYERFEKLEEAFKNQGGYTFEHNATKILVGLGFTEDTLENNPKALSGGWRMRLELAKLLIKNPDFLILDEPTNHLDLPTIMWLEAYLQKFKGTVLFVSHDESLLNRLPNIILHLKNGKLTPYQGNYDDYLEQYDEKEKNNKMLKSNIQKDIKSKQDFIDRFGAKASKAAQANSRRKVIDKLNEKLKNAGDDSPDIEVNIQIPITEKSGRNVLEMIDCSIGYTSTPLLKDVSLQISRNQKIAIIGANGLGKTTLMKSIIGDIPLIAGTMHLGHNVKIGYYAQNQVDHLDFSKTVLENLVLANEKMEYIAMRKLLGSFLFKGNDVNKPVKVLSGGEKSRLSLACMIVKDANFLLLDEPTNHLDILSTEILSAALRNYEGTVIFISHNRGFIDSTATHILALSSKRQLHLVKGTLDDVKPHWL